MTGLTEAVKSRTPLLVLAGESPAAALTSNFRIDQPAWSSRWARPPTASRAPPPPPTTPSAPTSAR